MKSSHTQIKSCVRISDSPLLNNICSEEFFWVTLNLADRMDYFGNGKPTAPLGKYEFRFPKLTLAEPLIAPRLLVNCPLGKGSIILDAFDWPRAFSTENMKVIRIVNALARNLGATVALKKETAWDYSFVDLAKSANMGYVDEYADDGKGGWLDMGRADLCFFLINHTGLSNGVGAPVAVPPFPGQYRFLGVPFRLTAPKKNNGKAIVALRGRDHSIKLPDKAAGIAVNHKAEQIWFLHSATYVPKKRGIVIARYVFRYADGSRAEFPVRSGIEVGDWCGPSRQKAAQVAWTGRNRVGLTVGLYLTSWKNPHPDKVITNIDVVANLSRAAFALIGITCGRTISDEKGMTTAAHWDFSRTGNTSPACFNPPAPLRPRDDSKTKPVVSFGQDGVHLTGKQYLAGTMRDVRLYPAGIIELHAKFMVRKSQSSAGYGLFQAMHYRRDGFRIHITNRMKILLAIFTGRDRSTFLKSASQLQPEKFYKLRVRMDGRTAAIFINGKLDAMKTCRMPAPCPDGDILIGHCSGSGYFDGTISTISLFRGCVDS